MCRKLVASLCLVLLFSVTLVGAQQDPSGGPGDPEARMATGPTEGPGDPDAKMVTGMSILGNKEAPMSLFIVPWKASELAAETSLSRTLHERQAPVDRDVFLRDLDFYQASVASQSSAPAAGSRVLSLR